MKVRIMKNQKANWREQQVVLLKNSGETRKGTQRGYNTITLGEIFAGVDKPTALEKSSAKAIIPSSYASTDARTHAVQREKGLFPMLAADIDKGDVAHEHIKAVVDAIFGVETASVIYSTSSATNENNKWRILAPLADPVPYDIWTQAQQAFFDILRSHDIVPDKTLERSGQLIYLPNVPPKNRREDGEPIHYKFSFAKGSPVDLSSQPLAGTIRRLAEAAEAAEANRAADRAARLLKKALRPAMGVLSPIERFNAENPLEDVLAKHGYEQKYAGSCDWRSPFQTSASFATRVHLETDGASWSSLSGSDAEAGLGAPADSGGRFGDAFDVFVHFEHNGDRAAALASISELVTIATTQKQVEAISATPYVWRNPENLPARPWVFGRWLLFNTIACIVAPGGVGKSTLVAGIVLSIATGRNLMGKTIWGGPQAVWLWNLEDDLDELSRSLQAAAKHHGITPAEIKSNLFVDSAMDGSGLCTAIEDRDGMKLLEPVYEALTAELTLRGIKMLVVDPFVSSHAVEENSNSKIDKIAKAWARVAKAAGCVVVLVHHTNKAGSMEVNANSARGASALISAARSALVLNRMSADEATQLGINKDERRQYISVQDDKHNRAAPEAANWFQLISVDLGNGDSVGVAEPWMPPEPADLFTTDDIIRVQEAAKAGVFRYDWRSPDWIGHVVGNVLGLDSNDFPYRKRIERVLSEWIKDGHFKTEDRQDRKRKIRKFIVIGNTPVSASSQANGAVAAIAPVSAAHCRTPAQNEAKPHSDTAPVQSLPFRGDCNWSGAAER
jgi:hypothetical protein